MRGGRCESFDRRVQLIEMVDEKIWRERINRRVAISKSYANDRKFGIARRINISACVTNHNGVTRHSAGFFDG